MATVSHLVTNLGDTTNTTSYGSGSFTPTAGDLLVVFVAASGTVATGTLTTSSNGLTFTKVTSAVWATSANTLYCFIADQLVPSSPTAMAVTFDCTGDSATGADISVEAVTGMSKTSTTAIKQSAVQSNAAAATPGPTFGASALTGNPTLAVLANNNNPAGQTPPSGWTELADFGYGTPATGLEVNSRDSGFTGTSITWTGTFTGATLAIELDTSAPPATGFTGWGTAI